MVITSNGRPVALLTAVDENSVEESLTAIRQARTAQAIAAIQRRSVQQGTDSTTLDRDRLRDPGFTVDPGSMRIVLDTNVLVSGLLTPFGTCGDVVRMLTSGSFTLCVDARIPAGVRGGTAKGAIPHGPRGWWASSSTTSRRRRRFMRPRRSPLPSPIRMTTASWRWRSPPGPIVSSPATQFTFHPNSGAG